MESVIDRFDALVVASFELLPWIQFPEFIKIKIYSSILIGIKEIGIESHFASVFLIRNFCAFLLIKWCKRVQVNWNGNFHFLTFPLFVAKLRYLLPLESSETGIKFEKKNSREKEREENKLRERGRMNIKSELEETGLKCTQSNCDTSGF